ncbi:SRPBCC family protein [Corallococcus praedator]|uniref:SRPBCC family protein n=1 Tax=Corallococcus praedator TaxID=2316724 RepID=A0ABX9Q6I3_9BACT|nr:MULTISPECIES: SRPBCC family protein [Corallococcus]RKH16392.1 SRPBCC family protein [Corallococcus sp. CA047B]RKH34566.1 SRPBCC family protein [Corallococcus sp. CA031C]RKH92657.1 SRPBCC family protein [Corallococcus praedator]
MSHRAKYTPGPAAGARIHKEAEKWTLVLVRDLRHPPAKVWEAITDPEHLREWAPFDSDRNLGAVGTAKLTTVGAPTPFVAETQVKRAEAPKLLEYSWGGSDMRWELEPLGGSGTRLTLWHNIHRGFISMGAAGWHICFDVLDGLLSGEPLGRIVGPEAMKFDGWQRLNVEYAKQFGVEPPGLPSTPRT